LDLLKEVLERTEYEAHCRKAGRGEVLEEYTRSVEEFQSRWSEANGDPPKLRDYLQETALLSDVDSLEEEPTGEVLLMTLHAAKGLEFDTVFLTGVEEGLIPHGQSLRGPEGDIEEERRLFYVGMTRAKNRLFLTRAQTRTLNGQTRSNPESLFLSEIPEDVLVREEAEGLRSLAESPFPASRDRRRNGRTQAGVPQAARQKPEMQGPWRVGGRVVHEHFGPGTIVDRKGSGEDVRVSVRFASGTKQLIVKYAPMREAG
jgi:DNA helicase-2/ATP-dependent DNA helicase PcrA